MKKYPRRPINPLDIWLVKDDEGMYYFGEDHAQDNVWHCMQSMGTGFTNALDAAMVSSRFPGSRVVRLLRRGYT